MTKFRDFREVLSLLYPLLSRYISYWPAPLLFAGLSGQVLDEVLLELVLLAAADALVDLPPADIEVDGVMVPQHIPLIRERAVTYFTLELLPA